jgi:hypothetical protein
VSGVVLPPFLPVFPHAPPWTWFFYDETRTPTLCEIRNERGCLRMAGVMLMTGDGLCRFCRFAVVLKVRHKMLKLLVNISKATKRQKRQQNSLTYTHMHTHARYYTCRMCRLCRFLYKLLIYIDKINDSKSDKATGLHFKVFGDGSH